MNAESRQQTARATAEIAGRARQGENDLHDALDNLRSAVESPVPGHEGEWAATVSDALRQLETAQRAHFERARTKEGPLDAIDKTRPALVRRAGELLAEEKAQLERMAVLTGNLQAAATAFQPGARNVAARGAVPDFSAVRQQVEDILAQAQHAKEVEDQLVIESVTTELGAGD